jgi:hypothetical protein
MVYITKNFYILYKPWYLYSLNRDEIKLYDFNFSKKNIFKIILIN